jgi:asparagine synthase (glutamine-hydrolysing)
MPGIAGVFSKAPDAGEQLARMLTCMLHEPAYSSGAYSATVLGCHLAWVFHRGSAGEGMPQWNANRDVCLIITGADFSDPSEMDALWRRGRRPDCDDAGYLVTMYEEYGDSFVARLNGCFSGVLVDLRLGIFILFNDRYGAGRIYCVEDSHGFYFASEAKALLRVLPNVRRLDPKAVAETLSVGCVLQNRTLFHGISLLPPASIWTFRRGAALRRQVYFSPLDWEQLPALDPEAFYDHFRNSFARLLPRYFKGSRPVAMSLTGGLDGRMIMAWARRPPGSLPCYSFESAYRESHDARLARQVAQHCGQPHTTIQVGKGFLDDFPSLAPRNVYLSDGTMDVSGAVELYVNRIARDIAPVRMTGNYGSEILRANVAFRPRRLGPGILRPELLHLVDEAEETYRIERRVRDITFIAFKQVPWHHHARLSVEQSQLTVLSPFLDNEIVSLMYRAPESTLSSPGASLRLIHDGDAALARLPTDRGIAYASIGVANRIRSIVREFSFKAEYAYDYGMPQWLARADRALASLELERLFLGRHKFFHFRTWYRGPLAPFVREVLLDRRALERSCYEPRVLEKMVDDHTAGGGNHTLEIHRALTLEFIHRELLERWTGD